MKNRLVAVLLAALLTFSVIPAVGAAESDATEIAGTDEIPTEAETVDATEGSDEPTEILPPAETTAPPEKEASDLAPTAAAIPKITRAVPSQNGVKLTYTAFEGADKYMIFCEKPAGGWKKLGESATTSFEHKLTPNNTAYKYTVRACDSAGKFISGYDKAGYTYSCLATPVLNRVESVFTGHKLIWNPVDGAAFYMVYIKADNQWKAICLTDKTYYINEDAVSGESYSYTVRCWDPDKRTGSSFYVRRGISGVYIDSPAIASFTPNGSGVTIKWNAVAGAPRYALFMKVDGRWRRIGVTGDLSFTHKNLAENTLYTYTIRCIDGNNNFCSGYNTAGFEYIFFANPSFASISADNGGTYLRWEPSPFIPAYRLYRKPFKGKWECIGNSDTGDFTDLTADKNTPYTYTLRGTDENGSLITGFTYTGVYYCAGKPAEGKITVNGTVYNFEKGKLRQGYIKSGGKLYYYNGSGVLQKNGIVGTKKEGYYYADKNGVCCTTKEIREAVDFLMTYCKGDTLKEKMQYAFMYLADNYPYVRVYFDTPADETDVPPFAHELFETKTGTCYRYAAGYACIARICGYRARFCFGVSGTLVHGWTEVCVDGDWLLCDVDANIPSYGNPDYAAYMMDTHFWLLDKEWYTELTIKDGKAVWGKKTYF